MTANRRDEAHATLLELGGAAPVLLEPLRAARPDVLGALAGYAVRPLERLPVSIEQPLREVVVELAQSWGASVRGHDGVARDLVEAARMRGIDASIRHVWPAGLSLDAPWRRARPELPAVLPALFGSRLDLELVGLELGLRRLVKREGQTAESSAALAQRLGERGFVGAAPSDDASVLFVAGNRACLARALEAERALRAGGDGRSTAVAELGELLGYPRCCVEAFARLEQGDDFVASACRVPPAPSPPAPPLGFWLDASLRLVSHLACRLDCPGTQQVSAALLEQLAGLDAAAASRWEQLARRVHVVTSGGQQLAMDVDGELATGGRIRDVARVGVDASGTPHIEQLPELVGVELGPCSCGLRSPDGRFWAVLVADHRG